MVKTYALFDVVGVKEAIKAGNGGKVLRDFWSAADSWTNSVGNSFGQRIVLDGNHTEEPHVSVVTFSDSALLFTRPEFDLKVFYEIAGSLKKVLESRVGRVYCIVSRASEIEHPKLPALGATIIDSNLKPAYFNVAGSGAAWVNLHLADRAVGRRKDWHVMYSLYAVGPRSLPPLMAARAQETFRTIDGDDELVFALG